MKKARACFADGGQISKADQLIAEMNAKYGVSGNSSAPAPVAQQPAVQQPEPKPQSKGLIGDAINIFSNRAKQIDKAAGYANGGKVRGYALGGIPDFGDNSQVGLEKRLAAMQASNGGAAGSVTAQWNTADQNDLMNNAGGINPSDDMAKKLGSSLMSAFSQPNSLTSSLQSGGLFNKNPLQAFSNGGLIEGIGTPTSDSIPAKVQETGEDIAVSTKERIVSHEQDKLLQRLAKAMGFDSVDAFFEAGTGKPVGPTIKGGKKAAAGGWSLDNNPDEYAKAMQATRNTLSIPSLSTNNSAAQGGIYKDVGLPAISMGAGQAPTIYDNGGLPTKTDRVTGSLPVATVSKPAGDGARPWYMQDPLTAISSGIEKSMNASQAAEDYNKSLYPAGTFDSPQKPAAQQSTTGNPLSSVSPTYPQSRPGASDVGLAGIGTKPSAASVSDNQFTQGGKNYTVNQTSQDGIKRVTGGTSPLYTNIDPAQGVAGLKNQMIGGDAASVNEGLSRYANANKIRGEMIANRDKDIPAGGYAPGILGDGGIEAANAEKTQRWRQDDLLRLATRGNQAAIGAIVNADSHRDVATMGNETQRQNAGLAAQVAGNRDNVTMRGQDLQAQSEAARIAGNPVDSQMKQLSLGQAQKMQQLYDKAAGGDASALKELQLRNPKEPNYSNRYITVPGGEETGPDGMTKIRRPSRVLDAQTGQWINEGGQVAQQQSAPASAIEYLKKNPNQAEAFKAKYGYIPAGL